MHTSIHGFAVRRVGRGAPLLCVPGGPLLPADYLGTLGGLDDTAELVLLDPPGSRPDLLMGNDDLRCDRIAAALDEVRAHLGLERVALLGHSAGANIVLRYAERHPDRIDRLLLVAPSVRAIGIEITDASRSAVAGQRRHEPWYPEAAAALAHVQAGTATEEDWSGIAPFSHGRWDAAAVRFEAEMEAARVHSAAAAFGAPGAFDPTTTRAALAGLEASVTVIAGSHDVGLPPDAAREVVALFPRAELVMQDGAGHFPWVDDGEAFASLARRALRVG